MQVENADSISMFVFFFLTQVLMQRVVCEVRALAVLPTKELAQQVGTLTNNTTNNNFSE